MDVQIKQVVSLASVRKKDKPFFIAVDGHSAAGKSTVAKKLASSLNTSVLVYTDDFYRVMNEQERFELNAREGYKHYYDWQRLKQEVLEPLSAFQVAEYRIYDWQNNKLGELKQITPVDYIIVEGCYSARPELSSFFDVVVLVETSSVERQKRQAERKNASQDWLNRWDAAESFYLETTDLANRADVVVLNS
jgi:uridine kinase